MVTAKQCSDHGKTEEGSEEQEFPSRETELLVIGSFSKTGRTT